MHADLPALESRRDELEAKLATARIQGDLAAVNKTVTMLCHCNAYISQARACDEVKRLNKTELV